MYSPGVLDGVASNFKSTGCEISAFLSTGRVDLKQRGYDDKVPLSTEQFIVLEQRLCLTSPWLPHASISSSQAGKRYIFPICSTNVSLLHPLSPASSHTLQPDPARKHQNQLTRIQHLLGIGLPQNVLPVQLQTQLRVHRIHTD